MKLEQELLDLARNNPHFMDAVNILNKYRLPEATIAAGAVRNLVWDQKSGQPSSFLRDNIDIYYRDPSESYEQSITTQAEISQNNSLYLWNLHNIALSSRHDDLIPQAKSINEAIAGFPEKCSAIGIQIDGNNLTVIAPFGLVELFELEVNPSPSFEKGMPKHEQYLQHIRFKHWQDRYPDLKINK